MAKSTDIVLSGFGLPDYACRGVDVEVAPIQEAKQYRRDANGTLRDVSDPVFRKYQIKVSGTDQQFPDFGGLWPGAQVTITVPVVFYGTGGTGATAPTGYNYPGKAISVTGRVTDFNATLNEWSADKSWSFTVEEQ